MLPKLNLDGSLKKRTSNVQERMAEEGQPGMYSPRISSSASATPNTTFQGSTAAAGTGSGPSNLPSTLHGATTTSPASSSISSSPAHSFVGPVASSPHLSPHELSLVEDGLVGISDPEVSTILAAKSRHGSSERSPNTERSSAGSDSPGQTGNTPPGKRRAAPLATLVDHQQARQGGPQFHAGGDASRVSEAARGAGESGDVSSTASLLGARGGASSSATAFASARRRAAATSSAASARIAARERSLSNASTGTAAAPGATPTASPVVVTPLPLAITAMSAEEVYVSGKPFHDYMSTYATRPTLIEPESTAMAGGNGGEVSVTSLASTTTATAAAGARISTVFHQNPSQYISALASQGDYVAIGDRTGRVVLMRKREMSASAHQRLLDVVHRREVAEDGERGDSNGEEAEATSSVSRSRLFASADAVSNVRDPYEFHVAQQAYVSVIDTLNSVEVAPSVTALAFLPQNSPTTYLLTSNEKVPKLYKVMSVRESANPFRAVDKISTKTIGPLTTSSRTSTVAMKSVTRYALSHEYNIHSICPITYSDQFVTADDSTVLLWCTEYPDTSIEAYNVRSSYDDSPRDTIRGVRNFPHEPFLFFVTTSGGTVRVVDTRQTLRWADQSAQIFTNPTREEDEAFSNVTNSICDCALSPSGRYIAGRDFMSVCLWDIRMAGGAGGTRSAAATPRRASLAARGDRGLDCGVVRRWELHPSLRSDLDSIYQSNLLFERFDVQFLSPSEVCTGGFNNSLNVMNVEGKCDDGLRTFHLPKTEGISTFSRTTVRSEAPTEDRAGTTGQGLGSRMTLMSRPSMSMNGSCGMMVACGQAVLQLSYNDLVREGHT